MPLAATTAVSRGESAGSRSFCVNVKLQFSCFDFCNSSSRTGGYCSACFKKQAAAADVPLVGDGACIVATGFEKCCYMGAAVASV